MHATGLSCTACWRFDTRQAVGATAFQPLNAIERGVGQVWFGPAFVTRQCRSWWRSPREKAPQPQVEGYLLEGSLEVKLPTIWTDEKQSREEAERRERLEERRVEEKE